MPENFRVTEITLCRSQNRITRILFKSLSIIKTIQLRDIVDILAIALLIFGLFKLIQETRAVQLLKGVIMLLIVYFLSSLFGLVMLSSLLRTFFEAAVVVIAIIFQPEIRKALEQMGRNNTYKKYIKIERRELL